MNLTRRDFLKAAGAAGAVGLIGPSEALGAEEGAGAAGDGFGLLVDTTKCLGCRACEAACSEANGLPEPELAGEETVFDKLRQTDDKRFTVVNRYKDDGDKVPPIFVKSQCMHCLQPACKSVCPANAFERTPEGAVVYKDNVCIGCRYCMTACPFDVPKYEYDKTVPFVRKCSLCIKRQRDGKLPACADACPSGALKFGKRKDLIEEAKTRIYTSKDDKYQHHIYGEHEAGGTSVLYLASKPFEKLGFKTNLGTRPFPEYTWSFLSAVPLVLALWPPLLMGLYQITHRNKDGDDAAHGEAAPKKEADHE